MHLKTDIFFCGCLLSLVSITSAISKTVDVPAARFSQAPVLLHGYALRSQSGQSLNLQYQYPKFDLSKPGSVFAFFQRKGLTTSIGNRDSQILAVDHQKNEELMSRMKRDMESSGFQGQAQLAKLDAEIEAAAPSLKAESARFDAQRQAERARDKAEAESMSAEATSDLSRYSSTWESENAQFFAQAEADSKRLNKMMDEDAARLDREMINAQVQWQGQRQQLEATWSPAAVSRSTGYEQRNSQLDAERKRAESNFEDQAAQFGNNDEGPPGTDSVQPTAGNPEQSSPDGSEPSEPRWLNPPSSTTSRYDTALSWDRWYAKMGTIVHDPLLKALDRHGNPSGANTVLVTVWKNHRLSVQVTAPGNPAFDQAIVEAYKSLDNNPAIDFPAGSCRTVVTYFIDNRHATEGIPIGITKQIIKGDQEYRHYQW
jgi:hypothetical protein